MIRCALRRICDRRVRPVVEVLPTAADRVRAGAGPELDRLTLAMWESWPPDLGQLPPGRPVRIVGFVPEGRWRDAVSTAAQLCGYGASVLVRRSVPARVRLAEADYYGITVIVVAPHGSPSVAVMGRTGPVPGAERTVALVHRFSRPGTRPVAFRYPLGGGSSTLAVDWSGSP